MYLYLLDDDERHTIKCEVSSYDSGDVIFIEFKGKCPSWYPKPTKSNPAIFSPSIQGEPIELRNPEVLFVDNIYINGLISQGNQNLYKRERFIFRTTPLRKIRRK